MKVIPSIGVIGGGSWATAIVKMLCENVKTVHWYMRNVYAIEHLKRHGHNPSYLPSVSFDMNQLELSNDINKVVEQSQYLIFVIPSAFLEKELEVLNHSLKDKIIFSAIKGIIPETGLIVGEHFQQQYKVDFKNFGVITGPCHAEEVAMERLSYLTIASKDKKKAKILVKLLSSEYIKCKHTKDFIGTEYAAMLKNIYAIACGIAHGLGYGDNFQSVLMSNAIREIDRFVSSVSDIKRNINNSAYLGDLLVTGYSMFSRNRTFGNMIGKGYTVKSAQLEMKMVAEGYYATKLAYELKEKLVIDTPIIDAIYKILYTKNNPKQIFKELTVILD